LNITITARHLRVTEEMKGHARERAEKMWKYYDRISHIEIVLDVDGQKYSAEMIVTATRHTQCIGRAKDADIHTALDKVTAKVERQLRKFKEKLKDHRPRNQAGSIIRSGDPKPVAAEPADAAGAPAEEEDWW